jgi:transposase
MKTKAHIPTIVSEEDRMELERRIRSQKISQGLAQRSRIILSLADGNTVEQVANEHATSKARVYRWRKRYLNEGLSGLADGSRSGRPRCLSSAKVKKILTATVERIPHEATHWSLRLMAKYAGVTKWQVQQVWEAADLKPHRIKNFKISNDPQFSEKVIDIVGLYMNPPDNAMVLSVDEKTQIQALDRTQPMLQLRPGQIERRTHDYKRNGTTNLYAAFDILTGQVMGQMTKRHRAMEFLSFLRQINRNTPKDLDLHLILDNSSTHKTKEVKTWLEKHPRFILHFTPTSASWLNAVESWFSQLERRSIHRGAFFSVKALKDEINRFIRAHNKRSAKPFTWTKSAESIIQKVEQAKKSLEYET